MTSCSRIFRSLSSAATVAAVIGACAPQTTPPGATPSPGDTRPPAPWSAAPLAAASVPSPYMQTWSAAANRATCALIAPASLGAGAGATARPATFSGGWAVAYDLPGTRSAFGVAGTGTNPTGDTYAEWPHRIAWSDGSQAGYGPEGGTGPQQLAYLQIAGQGCLYNVWSKLGVGHLEHLLGALRYVRG